MTNFTLVFGSLILFCVGIYCRFLVCGCYEVLIKQSISKKDCLIKLINLFNKFIYLFVYFLFICFCLHWVFITMCSLFLVVASGATLCCGVQASHCSGFSCCVSWALGMQASVAVAHKL